MGKSNCLFTAMFTKGDNLCDFLFASQDDKAIPDRGFLLRAVVRY